MAKRRELAEGPRGRWRPSSPAIAHSWCASCALSTRDSSWNSSHVSKSARVCAPEATFAAIAGPAWITDARIVSYCLGLPCSCWPSAVAVRAVRCAFVALLAAWMPPLSANSAQSISTLPPATGCPSPSACSSTGSVIPGTIRQS